MCGVILSMAFTSVLQRPQLKKAVIVVLLVGVGEVRSVEGVCGSGGGWD